jgi:hypothetical protein
MTIRAALLASFLVILLPGRAKADWNVGVGFESLSWTEHVVPSVEERGFPLVVARIGFAGAIGNGVTAEYGGRFYVGDVDYRGSLLFDPSTPVNATTRYGGTSQEAKLRFTLVSELEGAVAIDWDLWRRTLGSDQREDYRIVSLRLGAEHAVSQGVPWRLRTGFKVTLSTRENAHFDELGFDQNPALAPGGPSVTPYLEVGWAFHPLWAVAGSFDAYRFKDSNEVTLTGPRSGIFYQPASDMTVLGLWIEYRGRTSASH